MEIQIIICKALFRSYSQNAEARKTVMMNMLKEIISYVKIKDMSHEKETRNKQRKSESQLEW